MWDIVQAIAAWLMVTIATERITEILIHGDVFFSLRAFIGSLYVSKSSSKLRWLLYKITTCAWCCSVWISLCCVPTLPGKLFDVSAADNLIIKWFALVGMSNLWHAIFRLIFRGRVHTYEVTVINKSDNSDYFEEGIATQIEEDNV